MCLTCGGFAPMPGGFGGMHGSVEEWCLMVCAIVDQFDPIGPLDYETAVRGGCYRLPHLRRSSARDYNDRSYSDDGLGFE